MIAPTLTEFLLARIAEDEADAQTGRNEHWRIEGGGSWQTGPREFELVGGGKQLAEFTDRGTLAAIHVERWSPARVLAECEAKRRIVEMLEDEASAQGHLQPRLRPRSANH